MKFVTLFSVISGIALLVSASPRALADQPGYWRWSPTPPMGWNSYDAYKDQVTEDQVMANARYMKDHLLQHAWKYVVIDFRWYDPEPNGNDFALGRRAGARLAADAYGRMLPAPNRFPSAGDGRGFKALADRLHTMGLKFGFHMMRGIPRQSVLANTPIAGSDFRAVEAANTNDTCGWCPDMYGVRNTAAGQAWYDAEYKLYASWGLDFVKVDDLSSPYHQDEIEMIRKAIDRSGRHIVFSTSAGPTDIGEAQHIATHANLWRISGDFWDRWGSLNHQFDLFDEWSKSGAAGPGHFPDGDMIPFGEVSSQTGGPLHESGFTREEEKTLMSLWSLESSPLMLGDDLPTTDADTLALLTNDEVLRLDQDPLVRPAQRISQANGLEVWVKPLKNGSKAIGLFNRSDAAATVTLKWGDAGLTGAQSLRDLWQHKGLGKFNSLFTAQVPAHGAVLLRASHG